VLYIATCLLGAPPTEPFVCRYIHVSSLHQSRISGDGINERFKNTARNREELFATTLFRYGYFSDALRRNGQRHLCLQCRATNSFGTAHVDMGTLSGLSRDSYVYRQRVLRLPGIGLLFRVDVFNTFNRQLRRTGRFLSGTTFGIITSTPSPTRQFQLSAKYRF